MKNSDDSQPKGKGNKDANQFLGPLSIRQRTRDKEKENQASSQNSQVQGESEPPEKNKANDRTEHVSVEPGKFEENTSTKSLTEVTGDRKGSQIKNSQRHV